VRDVCHRFVDSLARFAALGAITAAIVAIMATFVTRACGFRPSVTNLGSSLAENRPLLRRRG
jgi:hypothetical protein